MTPLEPLPTWQRLSSKIIGALLGVLWLALIAISATLLLAWQLEGSSAAINETSSLRMHAYRLNLLAERMQTNANQGLRFALKHEIVVVDHIYQQIQSGDPQRPLYLPGATNIRQEFTASQRQWQQQIRPLLEQILSAQTKPNETTSALAIVALQEQIPLFAKRLDSLVTAIEKDSEQRANWLRTSQLALIAMALIGTVVLIYVMFLLIIRPVNRLQEGMQKMSQREFDVRLEVESKDEFGQLSEGFNQMADKLASLYANLEQRVAEKTAELEGQNRELALLYDCATFLQQPQKMESLCEGFLSRIRQYFGADGGSVRVLESHHGNLHMVVHQGISQELVDAEHCLKVGNCLCGAAVAENVIVLHDLRKMDEKHQLQCHKEGFSAVSVFQIHAHHQHLGFFNLHFRAEKSFGKREVVLLDTLGQLLGVALENIRLATRERAMAVSEERNLVAQGLHDSIAQGLTFMNIQVQMLEASLNAGNLAEVAEISVQLRAGIQESYEDVRELLQNFRSRLAEDNLVQSLQDGIDKFRRQTGIAVDFQADGEGPPLPREHQLQILFIVQEALSNIRKHAGASRVEIRLHDHQDIDLSVTDNGMGFDTSRLLAESHVGLRIMQERAQRIGATFALHSTPGAGTTVSMHLGRQMRQTA